MSRSKTASRLLATLDDQLSSYAVAAAAASVSLLGLLPAAQARVVFTPAHVKLTPNHHLFIDLNHDGVNDFELTDTHSSFADNLTVNGLRSGNALAQANGDCNPSVGVAALKAGTKIGKGQIFSNVYCMAQYIGADGGSLGSWAGGVNHRFLGFQFVIKGKKHFGWARLSVTKAPYTATLSGYAYETVPNRPIVAGKIAGTDLDSPETSHAPDSLTLGMLAQGAARSSLRGLGK